MNPTYTMLDLIFGSYLPSKGIRIGHEIKSLFVNHFFNGVQIGNEYGFYSLIEPLFVG
jgi:hypothetical protein